MLDRALFSCSISRRDRDMPPHATADTRRLSKFSLSWNIAEVLEKADYMPLRRRAGGRCVLVFDGAHEFSISDCWPI